MMVCIAGHLLVGKLLVVNPLVPTPMDAVASLVGLAVTLLLLSVLAALVVRVTRRRRETTIMSTNEVDR